MRASGRTDSGSDPLEECKHTAELCRGDGCGPGFRGWRVGGLGGFEEESVKGWGGMVEWGWGGFFLWRVEGISSNGVGRRGDKVGKAGILL